MNTKFNNEVYGMLPEGIEGIDSLTELALDIRWSWNHIADELWEQLDPTLWKHTHNPWLVLQTVSRDELKQQMSHPVFREKVNKLMEMKNQAASSDAWFQHAHPDSSLESIAYFSMEYMLSDALPIYSGGLGNVAGDQLKSASDLGVPVVGIGLLYQQGYFRQQIDKYGSQQALFPFNDPGQLPVTPLRLPNGEWLRFRMDLSGHPLWVRAWQVRAGRCKLYLMDSNDPANLPAHRGITSELYGGESELRIKQEILLGIGGYRLLRALNISPQVCHLNEGHTAFLVLERAHQFMKDNSVSFEEALAVTRSGNVFTTHTAVAAGFDLFSPALMYQYFGDYAANELHIDFNTLMALGRNDAQNEGEFFNIANLAVRGSNYVNAVSKLHGQVSRKLFSNIFKRWPLAEIPIGSVTNGVHSPTWDSEFADELWTNACGKDRWRGELENIEDTIASIPEATLWNFRNRSRDKFVTYVRERFEIQTKVAGLPESIIESAKNVLDPDSLTLGFARRFVPYKRTNLLLHDRDRLIRILTNSEFPVQLVIAGKSPSYDESGKSLIREWNQFIQQHNLYKDIIFLSDHDMLLTEQLVQGVDVWINTPRHPWEACGTSGMKVLVNGGINLSELDGWWAEAYTPEVGWALGDRQDHGNDPEWDAVEANALYDLLEQHVVPEFYSRNEKGIPENWIKRMRTSMATLTPQFSANRTVREYTEEFYIPAAHEYLRRSADKGYVGIKIVNAKHLLQSKWNDVHIGEVRTRSIQNGFCFKATLFFDNELKDKVSVELFANGINDGEPEVIKMDSHFSENDKEHIYHADVDTTRDSNDFTVRIIPCYEGISVPLEDNLIWWQH